MIKFCSFVIVKLKQMSKIPTIKQLSEDVGKICQLRLSADDFSENVELVKQFLILKGMTLNDYDNGFHWYLDKIDSLGYSKKCEMIEEYILEYQDLSEYPFEGLCENDLL